MTTTLSAIDEGQVDTKAPAGSNILDCSGKEWAEGLFGVRNFIVAALDAAGAEEARHITGNTDTVLVVAAGWTRDIPKGSSFRIYPAGNLDHEHTKAQDTGFDVGVDSSEILSANPNRKYASFVNVGTEWVYLAKGHDAVVGSGIPLGPLVGTYEITRVNMYKGAIHAIHAGAAGTVRVAIEEGE